MIIQISKNQIQTYWKFLPFYSDLINSYHGNTLPLHFSSTHTLNFTFGCYSILPKVGNMWNGATGKAINDIDWRHSIITKQD